MTPLYIAEEYPNVFETENNDASCCDSRLYEHGLYARADVKIGVAGPFTGPNATYGAQYWKGASQAVADITPPAASKAKRLCWCRG